MTPRIEHFEIPSFVSGAEGQLHMNPRHVHISYLMKLLFLAG